MTTEADRIKQLEAQVRELTAKVDYLAKVLGIAPTNPSPRRETGMGPIIDPSRSSYT